MCRCLCHMCLLVCVYALRIVSPDKIFVLYFYEYFLIINIYTCSELIVLVFYCVSDVSQGYYSAVFFCSELQCY